jgi:hypothetical protein
MARSLSDRMISIFTAGEDGRRPVYGGAKKFQDDPHWRDLILFYEYFHGDNGAGLGASHQTGWTASSPRSSTSGAAEPRREVSVHLFVEGAGGAPIGARGTVMPGTIATE